MANTVSTPWASRDWTIASPPVMRVVVTAAPVSTPHFACNVDDQAELAPLIGFGQRIPMVGAGEAALRAQAQVLDRHVTRRLVDAPLQLVFRFQHRGLAG